MHQKEKNAENKRETRWEDEGVQGCGRPERAVGVNITIIHLLKEFSDMQINFYGIQFKPF